MKRISSKTHPVPGLPQSLKLHRGEKVISKMFNISNQSRQATDFRGSESKAKMKHQLLNLK
jgi:hypothetical protein